MRKLCKNCFSERKSRICPICGYSGGGGNNTGNALKRGTRLAGRYTVGGVIGSGSFGITYIAYDLKNDVTMAVKEYFPRLIAVREANGSVRASSEKYGEIYGRGAEEFYREAEYVFQFNGNPNIVSVSDYFYENNTSYLVMEYLSGITLERYVNNCGPLTDAQTVYIAEKILMALIAVHSAQLLHRDISPDNIMLCADGKVKLIDFGAARQFTADSMPELTVIMKNGFTSAEQYMRNGSFGEWTDIYSLGAVLYYAVTGNVPENPYERMINNSELDFYGKSTNRDLQDIICKAVSISKAKRYKSAAEMKKAVSDLKIKGKEITLPDNFGSFKARSFSATAPTGHYGRKKSKFLSYCAIGALTASAAFVLGMTVRSGNTAVSDAEQKDMSFSAETVSEVTTVESGSVPKAPVKIEFDGEQKSLYEFDGIISSAVLRDFGGDVEITYNFTFPEDVQTTGLIPAGSDGNYMIKYITGDYIFAQPHGYIDVKNGDYIDINGDTRSLSFTLSREGIESLGNNDFGIYNCNLILDSVEIKSGSKQNPVSYCNYTGIDFLEPLISEENGDKIVFADLTDTDEIMKRYSDPFDRYTTWGIPKYAFDEFSGDVLVTLELEHINTADYHIFYIYDCGMNPHPTFKSVILGDEKDKFGNHLTHFIYDGVFVSEDITECSFVIPRKAVENMLGGINFGEDHLTIKSVRLESAGSEITSAEISNASKTPVTIAFDGEFKENFEYYEIVPVSQLKSFGGDVKITVDFAIGHKKGQDDQEEGVGGFIPADGSGKCVIEYLSTSMTPWADENGLILITDDDVHYEMTISQEGIEKLQGGSFGFELYNLAVTSVTLENGEKIGKYYFRDYSDYYLDTVKSTNDDGSTVITADITEKYIDSSGINHATIPRSAFLEFDGDVLMTLEIEHTGSEDFQGFLIWNRGALWSTLDGRILLTEMVDRKKSQVLLQYVDKYWIYPDKELSECSVIVPREAVEKMSGGIFFHVMNMKIKRVRLESAENEVEYGNVSN